MHSTEIGARPAFGVNAYTDVEEKEEEMQRRSSACVHTRGGGEGRDAMSVVFWF
jgi:hypothetical protein